MKKILFVLTLLTSGLAMAQSGPVESPATPIESGKPHGKKPHNRHKAKKSTDNTHNNGSFNSGFAKDSPGADTMDQTKY